MPQQTAGKSTVATATAAAVHGIEVITVNVLNDQGGGFFTATVGARPDMQRDNGQPSQAGDVLSMQPDGTLQTRAAGTNGAFELCAKTSGFLVYSPKGNDGRTFVVPFTDVKIPNT